MFLGNRSSQVLSTSEPWLAWEIWCAAEELVSERWQAYLDAGEAGRKWAFAAYVAALDAEEHAAADLAAVALPLAA
jgi:hypothetical protein